MKICTVFKESTGEWSMRRVLAFLFAFAAIASGFVSVFLGAEWKTIAASFCAPGAICLLLLLFTTWGDVASLVSAARKG